MAPIVPAWALNCPAPAAEGSGSRSSDRTDRLTRSPLDRRSGGRMASCTGYLPQSLRDRSNQFQLVPHTPGSCAKCWGWGTTARPHAMPWGGRRVRSCTDPRPHRFRRRVPSDRLHCLAVPAPRSSALRETFPVAVPLGAVRWDGAAAPVDLTRGARRHLRTRIRRTRAARGPRTDSWRRVRHSGDRIRPLRAGRRRRSPPRATAVRRN